MIGRHYMQLRELLLERLLCISFLGDNMNPVELIVKDIISEYYAYLSLNERNSTEIEKSIALLKTKASELQAQTEFAQKYFELQMSERERLLNSASKVLDKAMNTGDVEFAEIAVKIIDIVHQKSPFSF